MKISYKRPAIAMIELIFSIVIMGIVLMSAPMLISTATQSTFVALQQEGINEAASRVSEILTYAWDENNTHNSTCISPTLHVSNGDNKLDVNNSNRRVGVPIESDFRTFKCGTEEYNASSLGLEGSEKNDIDDFSNNSQLVEIISGSGGTNYIEKTTVNIATSIYYATDTALYNKEEFSYAFPHVSTVATTNIKGITVTLTSTSTTTELSKTIILHAFSCNIGGDITTGYKWREMP